MFVRRQNQPTRFFLSCYTENRRPHPGWTEFVTFSLRKG